MRTHRLPVLRARDVEDPVEQAPTDAAVEDLEEGFSRRRLNAAQTGQEGRF